MEKMTPGQLLQLHGIEISPDERKTTEQIVADYIIKGIISIEECGEVIISAGEIVEPVEITDDIERNEV